MSHSRNAPLTRRTLLEAAEAEFYRSGYRATGLDAILKRAGTTKGALYHHFGNKLGLGYAVVDELIGPMIQTQRILPFTQSNDPRGTLMEMALTYAEDPNRLLRGCPMANLAREMSPEDAGFRARLSNLYRSWRQAVEGSLARAIAHHLVSSDLAVESSAVAIIAAWDGALHLCQAGGDPSTFETAIKAMCERLKPNESKKVVHTPHEAGLWLQERLDKGSGKR